MVSAIPLHERKQPHQAAQCGSMHHRTRVSCNSFSPSVLERCSRWLMKRLWYRSPAFSVDEVLIPLLTAAQCAQVMKESQDPRSHLEFVARILAHSAVELLGTVACELKLPFACTVSPVDLCLLPSGVTIAEYRRAGAIPIITLGKVTGVICACPQLLASSMPEQVTSNRVLALWSTIARALDESEANTAQLRSDFLRKNLFDQREGAIRTLSELMAQVSRYNRTGCTVEFRAAHIRYTFVTERGGKAYGELSRKFRPGLELLLSSLHEGTRVQELPTIENVIRDAESIGTFHVTWGLEQSSPKSGCGTDGGVGPFPVLSDHAPHVLIVDDNECFGHVLEKYLHHRGIRTTYVSSGAQALAIVRQQRASPDLILSDVHMPTMSGFQLLGELRQVASCRETPVIVLTSDDDAETEATIIEQGADLFLSKTENPKILCAYVDRILARQKRKAA